MTDSPDLQAVGADGVDGNGSSHVTRILIANTCTFVRTGFAQLLRDALPEFDLAEALTLAEAIAILQSTQVDLLIIDPELAGCEESDSLLALRGLYPNLQIMVRGRDNRREKILTYLLGGMNGYIVKSMSHEQTLGAIRSVLGGGVYAPFVPHLDNSGVDTPNGSPGDPALPQFTERQREVLRLLAEGRSTKDIARIMDLGIGTVKVHLSAVYRTLGARTRLEAVVRAGLLK